MHDDFWDPEEDGEESLLPDNFHLRTVAERVRDGKAVAYRTGMLLTETFEPVPGSDSIFLLSCDSQEELEENVRNSTGFETDFSDREASQMVERFGASPWRVISNGQSNEVDVGAISVLAADLTLIYNAADDGRGDGVADEPPVDA